ncbi:MAG: thioredoxin domain-containing protein [Candidatus Acidiferrales bacterium]
MNLRRLLPILAGAALVIAAFSVRSLRAAAQDTAAAEEARLSAEKSLGSPSAPIKLIVYDDYECPACGNFYEQTLRQLIDTYVAEGKVYLVHRDFPLPMHQYSRQAARWVNAAARIGKFEAVERALFDNQMAWSEYGSANPKGNIKPLVQSALTPAEFKRVERLMQGCESDSHDEIKGCAVDAQIQRDIAAGELLPITQTPTFVVSYKGQSYPPAAGGVSWVLLKQFFDQLLSQK